MEQIQDSKKTFINAVYEFLLTLCDDKETITKNSNDLYKVTFSEFLTKTGISKASIKPNSYIKCIYLTDPSDITGEAQLPPVEQKTTIFVNLEKNEMETVSFRKSPNHTYICADEIKVNKKEFRISQNNIILDKIYKNKTLNVERFDQFLFYVIRLKIIFSFLEKFSSFDPSKIYAKNGQNSVIPFILSVEDKNYIFYEKSKQIKNSYYSDFQRKNNKNVFVRLSPQSDIQSELSFKCTISQNLTTADTVKIILIKKINNSDLNKHILSFNEIYGSFFIDDFISLFKYRKFEKTRYVYDFEDITYRNPSIFKYSVSENVEIGNRTALEDGTLWFSNYDSLNDPFDLIGRKPKKTSIHMTDFYDSIVAGDYDTVKTPFLIFCATSRNDNILMWSHYGDSHKGTCICYPMSEIVNAIEADSTCGICFYGKIHYDKTRPIFNLPYTYFRFISYELAVLRFNIISMFNKYRDWIYENEYRFLILPINDEKIIESYAKGHGVTLNGTRLFLGANFNLPTYQTYLDNFFKTYKKFSLSKDGYKLI